MKIPEDKMTEGKTDHLFIGKHIYFTNINPHFQ